MKSRLLQFIDRLRAAGLPITLSETLDASRALRVFGVEPVQFREALAATVIKDEGDRATFDDEFAQFFAVPLRHAGKRGRLQTSGMGNRVASASQRSEPSARTHTDQPERRAAKPEERKQHDAQRQHGDRQRLGRLRSLQDVPLKELTPDQIEDCDLLLRHLANQLRANRQRRLKRARHGRLDLRRTLRASIASGGVPMVPEFRTRRPGKPDLVALCDLSHSVALASRFLLSLLAGAPSLFRRVRLFGYVALPVEIWLQDGQLVMDEPLDLFARSDFGRVLERFWDARAASLTRNTLLLILGDARNNRRPPRGDLMARMGQTVQRIAWLNPEATERWDTGDSVMRAYAPYCTEVLGATTLRQLYVALKALSR